MVKEVLRIIDNQGAPAAAAPPKKRVETASSVAEGEVLGTVKWFDKVKEFGFISADDGQKDIFVHKSCLQRAGIAALETGQKLHVQYKTVPKGREAVAISLAE